MFNKNSPIDLINQARSQARFDFLWQFFAKRRKFLKGTVISIVVLLIGWFAFDIYQKSAQEKYSEIFHQAMIDEERGNISKAQENLQKIYNAKFAPSGVKGLASMRYAGLLLAQNSNLEALKVYETVADNGRYDRYLRELAGLFASRIIEITTDAKSDKATQDKALKQINRYESYSKILRPYIAEQKGILEMKFGNLDKSYEIFAEIINDKENEQALKMRVSELIKILVAQGFEIKVKQDSEKK
jgi:hypothetical protein